MWQGTPEQLRTALSAPFSSSDIEWRVSATNNEKTRGLAVPYVTNRAIQNRLDDTVGIDGWRNDFVPWKSEKAQLCGISIYFPAVEAWITKWDGADDSDFESVKGGLSDSMKRAAVEWTIGRYLYGMTQVWVSVNVSNNGKRITIRDEERPRLDKAHDEWVFYLQAKERGENLPKPKAPPPLDPQPYNNPSYSKQGSRPPAQPQGQMPAQGQGQRQGPPQNTQQYPPQGQPPAQGQRQRQGPPQNAQQYPPQGQPPAQGQGQRQGPPQNTQQYPPQGQPPAQGQGQRQGPPQNTQQPPQGQPPAQGQGQRQGPPQGAQQQSQGQPPTPDQMQRAGNPAAPAGCILVTASSLKNTINGGQRLSVQLIDDHGSCFQAYLRNMDSRIVPGILLSNAQISTQNKGGVLLYTLETYQIVGPLNQNAA